MATEVNLTPNYNRIFAEACPVQLSGQASCQGAEVIETEER